MPYGNQCRWCGRTIDLPLGDECGLCQDRLNLVAQLQSSCRKAIPRPRNMRASFNGVTLILREDGTDTRRLECTWVGSESQLRADLQMFFEHANRIEIDRMTGVGK